jgi:hypothetical protein
VPGSATNKIEELAAAKIDYYKRRMQREEERHVLDMKVLQLQKAYYASKTEQGSRIRRPVLYCWQIFYFND